MDTTFKKKKSAEYNNFTAKYTDRKVSEKRELFVLELRNGKPVLLVDMGAGAVTLTISSPTLADGLWHHFDISWKNQSLRMSVDGCADLARQELQISPQNSVWRRKRLSAGVCTAEGVLPEGASRLSFEVPLQLGGRIHSSHPRVTEHSLQPPLSGCIRNLRMNGELQDLGYRLLAERSIPHCKEEGCAMQQHCLNSHMCPRNAGGSACQCEPGLGGASCDSTTTPIFLHKDSFISISLSTAQLPHISFIQFRFRTREANGILVSLRKKSEDTFTLFLDGGVLCLSARLEREKVFLLCLAKRKVRDGKWHSAYAGRRGTKIWLSLDEGDKSEYNCTSLDKNTAPLVHAEGILIGGHPRYSSRNEVVRVDDSLNGGCIDDLRIDGRPIHLTPLDSEDDYQRIESFNHVTEGCHSPHYCRNITCRPPLSCIDSWNSYHCGCPEGKRLSSDGKACVDINECLYEPCLNGGYCKNTNPGYSCSCDTDFEGSNCELLRSQTDAPLTHLPLLFCFLGAFFLIALLTILLMVVCKRRRRSSSHGMSTGSGNNSDQEASMSTLGGTQNLDITMTSQPSAYLGLYEHSASSTSPGDKQMDIPLTVFPPDVKVNNVMNVHFPDVAHSEASVTPSLYAVYVDAGGLPMRKDVQPSKNQCKQNPKSILKTKR